MDARIGIVGAGLMGRSIAQRALQSGLAVRLYDNSETARASAAAALGGAIGTKSASVVSPVVGRFSANENQPTFAPLPGPPPGTGGGRNESATQQQRTRLAIVEALPELSDCDVIIEAVVENRSVKRRLLQQLAAVSPTALLATNTSSLSIGDLATAVDQAGRFCGLHFCHPIVECPLVEIVPGPETTEDSLQRAETFVRQLHLDPLRTRDVPGFAVNRLLFPYFEGAIALARGGVDWVRIERCATDFGMRLGPLSQMDEIGIDVILRAAAAFHRGNPVVPPQSELLLAMYQSERKGRKSGRGFFDYSEGPSRLTPDRESLALCARHAASPLACDDHELTLRLFVPMFAAACNLIEQQVVAGAAEVRRALRDGLGCRGTAAELPDWGGGLGQDRLAEWQARLDLPAFNPAVLCLTER